MLKKFKIIIVVIITSIYIMLPSFKSLKPMEINVHANGLVLTKGLELLGEAIVSAILVGMGVVSWEALKDMNPVELFMLASKAYSENQEKFIAMAKIYMDTQEGKEALNEFIAEATTATNTTTGQNTLFDFKDFVDDNANNVIMVSEGNIDMKGYGALCIGEGSMLAGRIEYYYCDYMKVVDNRVVFYTDGIANKCILYQYVAKTGELMGGPYNHSLSSRPLILHYGTNGRLYYQYTVYGDIRYSDGTKEYVDVPAIPADIGEFTDAKGEQFVITADGTVKDAEGNTVTVINNDGSVTYEGDTYYPTYNYNVYTDEGIGSLLEEIIAILNENALEDDKAVVIPNVDVSMELDELALEMPVGISTVFPFCLPFDFVRGLKLLQVPKKAPIFNFPIEIPSFGMFEGKTYYINADFTEYDEYFNIMRYFTLFLFSMSLIFLSFKIVKGVR